ncbi:ParA family protein, partial [Bifidobacterium longum]|uniref:ParA family protein n=1 Tax=Bifidobacterium longum TaxID=216816 RepID=UPI0010394F57
TVAFVNLKGWVGKTTSAIGTADALARLGHTVTVRDADPSGAATVNRLTTSTPKGSGRPADRALCAHRVAAPAEEEWVLIDTPPLQTDLVEAAVDAADLVLLVTTTGPIDLERMLETIRQINKPSSVLLTQTRYGTRSLRHAEEFLAENGLARCQETIPYKEAMRLASDEGRFPSASGYGLIAKELSDAFAA